MDKEDIVERRKFEAAMAPHFKVENPFKRVKSVTKYNGEYFYAHMNLAWASWLAAKQDAKQQRE